jgi:5-(carboxyamino)imidazole ribonucleotide synthase
MTPSKTTFPLPPGGIIGIIGGGQLGRMTALAAARLGYRVHIFCPETDSPASHVAAFATVAAYDDAAALSAFAAQVDVVTFEFENIPVASVKILTELVPVRPSWSVLEIAQDRCREKQFFNDLGIGTAPWAPVRSAADLRATIAALGTPAILKTARMGYDGKGQIRIAADTDLDSAWAELKTDEAVLEGFVDFAGEVSVIVARGADGSVSLFDPAWNVHTHHILDTTTIPAPIIPQQSEAALRVGRTCADALDLIGLLAVELFLTKDGRILANEMAPRPHNSGHWTMDACITDQFEQFVRAVCGLPFGSPERHSDAVMTNLIGDDMLKWHDLLADPTAKLHLYGKAEARAGRKMGHVTKLLPKDRQL